VTNAPNIGSLFRICDAFGVEKLILCGENINLGRKMAKTSRATENFVNYELRNNALNAIQGLKENNYQITALEITDKSVPIHQYKFKINQP